MKVAILAGGVGSRLSEETVDRPKPLVEIGGRPILWHIMMHYAAYGYKEFVIAVGYKGEMIKRYMMEYSSLHGDLKVDVQRGRIESQSENVPGWLVQLSDTGLRTQTGGRIKRLRKYLSDGTFMLTWGDGVSDVNLDRLLEFHRSHGKLATVTAVQPTARFGHLELENERVVEFREKPQNSDNWINGAFFVLEPAVFDYIEGDMTHWEHEPLQRLAKDGELMAYRHDAFWQCMDTLRDKKYLEQLWNRGDAPWKTWD